MPTAIEPDRATKAAEPRTTRGELARTHLVLTAERLFAEHGIDNVSLRQIAAEAGYINPATIQYHFGTKTALLRAIVEHRVPAIDRRRLELMDQVGDDLDGLAEVMARPMLELDESSHYSAFVAALLSTADAWEVFNGALAGREGERRMQKAYVRLLPEVPSELRSLRMRFATSLMLRAIADRRHLTTSGRRPRVSDAAFERELIAAMAAVLKSSGR